MRLAMAKMAPTETPSRAVQAVCPYWLISREGSKTKEQGLAPSETPRAIAAILAIFTAGVKSNTPPMHPKTPPHSHRTLLEMRAVAPVDMPGHLNDGAARVASVPESRHRPIHAWLIRLADMEGL